MSENINDLLNKTKGQLFFQQGAGFLGRLLCKVSFVWSTEIDTAAISSKKLYWNPDFFMKLDAKTRVTVLAHELWHNALMHGARLNGRCPDVWNIAADHVINLLLKQHGYYMDGFPYVMDAQFVGWSTDEIYDHLQKPGGPGSTPPPGSEDGLGQDIMPAGADDLPDLIADVVAAMAGAGMSGGKPGDIPAEITLIIDKFLNPKLPWETILYNFFNALTSQEYSFTRPNRRYEDPMIPGITGRNGLEHLIYYLDISGSITDQHILRFNSEVKFIQETLTPERLTLVTFDTEIHDVYEFEKDDPFEKIVVTGRGGTDLADVFEHAQANNPTAMIVFTDLEVGIPDNPGIPIIWICVDNLNKTVPYGQLIHLKD